MVSGAITRATTAPGSTRRSIRSRPSIPQPATKIGEPIATFGNGGAVDLNEGLGPLSKGYLWNSAPLVARDVIVMGSAMVDQDSATKVEGEPGNVRAFDVRTGKLRWTFHVVPQGGQRLGDTLYATSVVCVEAATGKRVWHYQTVHHDLFDYDNPAAPILVDITVDGKTIKAVAQITKQSFTYVLDRVTGKPVWPIEERPVPASTVPRRSNT